MNVDEFLTNLYNDELSDMFIGNRNSKEEPREKLLPLMNKAMLQAYAKYNIKFDHVPLTVNTNDHTYVMINEDALAIMAVTEDSSSRILKTHEVQILGQILYFPDPVVGNYTVRYKVKPTKFVEEQNDEETEIELPDLLVSWMSSWVASRIFLSRKDDVSIAKGTELMSLANTFETAYQATNTTNEYTHRDTVKLVARGFA